MDGSLPDRLARAITMAGPIPLSQYMAAANAEYYATRDPLGSAGDFTTAPEISQMFGESISSRPARRSAPGNARRCPMPIGTTTSRNCPTIAR
jgi:hypothetical protein